VLSDALKSGKLIDINKSEVIDYQIPGTNKTYFKTEDMLQYDINYFLDNCQATDFVKFKNEIKNSTCPFTHFTE
jgi:hypothetical protein